MPIVYNPGAVLLHWTNPVTTRLDLIAVRNKLAAAEWIGNGNWLLTAMGELGAERGALPGSFYLALRVALMGDAADSENLFAQLIRLGRTESLSRIDAAVLHLGIL